MKKLPSKTMTAMVSITGALVVMLIFMMGSVIAEQTVKTVEVPIGFVAQSLADTDYITTLNINPPDGIDEIISFELVIRGDFQASTEVVGRVRKTGTETIFECEPSVWTTPNLNTPNYVLTFDCSSLAHNFDFTTGMIDVGFRMDKIAQNLKGYVRMTYYNRPKGTATIFGTEYEVGDVATIFLQLQDEQGLPVNNGACQMDVYYPNQPNSTHAIFLDNAPLLYLNNSDGIYYYDLTVPNVTGVYMVSASCSYALQSFWIYPVDSLNTINRTVEVGVYTGSPWVLNDGSDYLYTKCASVVDGPKSCIANYTWNITEYGINTSSVTNLHYHYLGETSTSGVTLTMYAWNYTNGSWFTLLNTLVFSGHATSGYPTGINDHLGNTISSGVMDFINSTTGEIKVKLEALHGTNYDEYDNWLAISVQTEEGVIIDVKGSGELHVEDHFTNLTEFINHSIGNLSNLTAEEVWNFPTRNLTYINFSEVISRIDLLDANISANFTEILRRLDEINQTTNVTYTYIQGLDNHSVADIWSYANRTLSDYNFTEILSYLYGINQTTFDIRAFQLNELSDNLTQINLFLQDINETANNTYDYLTGLVNLTASDVWNYTNRNLTYYPNQTDLTDYTLIQAYVWNATNRSLTEFNFTDLDINDTNIISAIDATNTTLYNAIADSNASIIAVMNAHNGTIMTKLYLMQDELASVNDSVNNLNNLSASEVWSFGNRTLTEFNFTVNINDTAILNAINATNSSLYQAIVDSNTSIIAKINQTENTIMLYLYNMTDQLNDIEDNTITIIGDIVDVQNTTDEIYNQTTDIWWLLWNLSVGNITVQADVNWTEGIEEGANVSNPVVLTSQFVTFAAATSPGESVTNQYCLDNTTLISEINTTKCLFGECFNMSTELPTTCQYGCYMDSCNPEPFDKFLLIMMFFLAVIAIIIIIALAYNRWG